MAELDIICVDSDGDTEERAVLISDTEEDVIFVTKIEGRSALNHRRPNSNEIVDLSDHSFGDHNDPLDLSLPGSRLDSGDAGAISLSNGESLPLASTFSDLLAVKVDNSCPERENRMDDLVADAGIPSDNNVCSSKSRCGTANLRLLDLSFSPKSSTSEQKSLLASPSVISPSSGDQTVHFVASLSSLDSPKSNIADNKDVYSMCSPASIGHDSDLSDTDVAYSSSSSSSSDSDLPSLNSGKSSMCGDSSDVEDLLASPPVSPASSSDGSTLTLSAPTTPVSPWPIATPMFDKLLQFPTIQSDANKSKPIRELTKISRTDSRSLLIRPILKVSKQVKCKINQNISDLHGSTTCTSLDTKPICCLRRASDHVQLSMVPPKKRRPSMFTTDDEDDVQIIAEVHNGTTFVKSHGECSQCEKLVEEKLLLSCACSRYCCNKCLEKQVTTLLAKGQKGLPKCGSSECELILDLDKLCDFLPAMVMTILKKKIEEEAIGDIMEWLKPHRGEGLRKDIEKVMELPKCWEPMMDYQDHKLVSLSPDNLEYIEVHNRFHLTMHSPRAQIQSIKRVQNPTLWRFYAMKRHQMARELGLVSSSSIECQLFHGTKKEHTESICRDNFDWRMCGVHGTVYGMGTYFAHDATYSHRYTDQPGGSNVNSNRSSLSSATMHLLSLPNNPLNLSSRPPTSSLATFPPSIISTNMLPAPPSSWNLPPCLFRPFVTITPNSTASSFSMIQQSTNPSHALMTSVDPMLGQAPGTPTAKPVHHHVMFLAKVLIGQYTLGKPTYRKPPPLDNKATKYYDSCVNNVNSPSIYVIFEKSQCYPEYVIDYINEPVSFHGK